MALEYFYDPNADPIIVRMVGGLTLGPKLAAFSRTFSTLLSTRRPSGLVLDMAGVSDIDSTGLGELVILYTASSEAGSGLCLVRPAPRVCRLLEMTRVSGLFPSFDKEAAAVDWARTRR